MGGWGMRPSWWAYILVMILTSAVAYQLSNQSSLTSRSLGVSDKTEQHPLDQKSDRPLIYNNETQLQNVDSAPADLKPDPLPSDQHHAGLEEDSGGTGAVSVSAGLQPDPLPSHQDQARLEDSAGTGAIESPAPNDTKQ